MNFKKLLLLKKIKLPEDIIEKIKKDYFEYVMCIDCYRYFKSNTCHKCNSCQKWLCETHSQRALKWGLYYRRVHCYRMCDQCCWWEIS